ncbi:ABC transporter permease [Microbaculum sp. FT89]|uniref:ABC transporter permease n=1 Tax=Microbaculum sp. FT89 TaxID=3447298 RepID=UPI003F537F6A
MRLELDRRAAHSQLMTVLSPVIAIGLTLIAGAILFLLAGISPIEGLYTYFISPVTSAYSAQEVLVKASPLILIALGLSLCFQANVWNIGAEGQYTLGAVFGGWLALTLADMDTPLVLVAVLLAGIVGGMLWAAIPALLKTVFRANEILTSLMLTYVALLLIDYLVRGPLRDPAGYNFPESALFSSAATLPGLSSGGRLHLGVLFAFVLAIVMAFALPTTLKGFEIRTVGQAPKAARFAGFGDKGMVLFVFLASGALAGLAGIAEVSGTLNQLLPTISPGYGFTAIIVAFLGRLNPIGIVFAGIVMSISFIGGEAAQIRLGLPLDVAKVFQGILLFFILACDTLIYYRLRLYRPRAASAGDART